MADEIKTTAAEAPESRNFIHAFIEEDIAPGGQFEGMTVHTRFPPEPNGYLHIGHCKALTIDFGTAEKFGGLCNLRMDDTNPTKEDEEFVEAIKEDIHWLGFDWGDRFFYGSDYFEEDYRQAVGLIKKGLAYVCELSPEEFRAHRGDIGVPATSPYRDRPIEESLDLFARMRAGEFPNGTMTLRAKIDLTSGNFNMRDPVIYRINHMHHHRQGDKWCIYPMYDFAHPIQDALEGIPVVTEVLPIEEAKKKGAVAMFGEKYSDVVRVVEMGGVSMEFCGGTHVDNTAKVGPFRIKSEASVASGVRRIEATVGQLTLDTVNRNQQVLFHIAQMFKTNPGELENRLEQQMNEMKELRHALEKFKEEASLGEARSFLMSAKDVGGLKVITAQRDGMDAAAMRKQGDFLRDKEPGVVGVLASVNEGKVTLLAVCGKDAVARGIKAGDIIKAIAPICGGKGGGKPDSAMGGGTEPSKVDDALAAVDDFVAGKL